MHSMQTNERLADADQLKLTPPLEKVKINYFVSLNTKSPIYDHNSHM
jgi:hypothetical protein